MRQVRPETLDEIDQALQRYSAEVRQAKLSFNTKRIYTLHARAFVRWLAGGLDPAVRDRPSTGEALERPGTV